MDTLTAKQKVKDTIMEMDADGQDTAVLALFSLDAGYNDPLEDEADRNGMEVMYYNHVDQAGAYRVAILWRKQKPSLKDCEAAVKRHFASTPAS